MKEYENNVKFDFAIFLQTVVIVWHLGNKINRVFEIIMELVLWILQSDKTWEQIILFITQCIKLTGLEFH